MFVLCSAILIASGCTAASGTTSTSTDTEAAPATSWSQERSCRSQSRITSLLLLRTSPIATGMIRQSYPPDGLSRQSLTRVLNRRSRGRRYLGLSELFALFIGASSKITVPFCIGKQPGRVHLRSGYVAELCYPRPDIVSMRIVISSLLDGIELSGSAGIVADSCDVLPIAPICSGFVVDQTVVERV